VTKNIIQSEYEYTVPFRHCIFLQKVATSRHRFRWESNIKIDLGEVGWEGMAWTHLVHGSNKWQAVMNMVINL
jgi:hypothetical protein